MAVASSDRLRRTDTTGYQQQVDMPVTDDRMEGTGLGQDRDTGQLEVGGGGWDKTGRDWDTFLPHYIPYPQRKDRMG